MKTKLKRNPKPVKFKIHRQTNAIVDVMVLKLVLDEQDSNHQEMNSKTKVLKDQQYKSMLKSWLRSSSEREKHTEDLSNKL